MYTDIDNLGYLTLNIERLATDKEAIYMADNMADAKSFLYNLVEKYNLCLAKCDLHQTGGPCFNYQIEKCFGACCAKETPKNYNTRVQAAFEKYGFQSRSFFMIDVGRNDTEKSVICIENGQYKGFGYVDIDCQMGITELRNSIKKYSHNRDIQLIIKRFDHKNIQKIPYQPNQFDSI